jgi:uncharacterized protein DUF3892
LHYITAVHFSGGSRSEEQIVSVRWLNATGGVSRTSTAEAMIDWIENGNVVYVGGPDGHVRVGVVRPSGRAPYLRTYANGEWTDNLRSLPLF